MFLLGKLLAQLPDESEHAESEGRLEGLALRYRKRPSDAVKESEGSPEAAGVPAPAIEDVADGYNFDLTVSVEHEAVRLGGKLKPLTRCLLPKQGTGLRGETKKKKRSARRSSAREKREREREKKKKKKLT